MRARMADVSACGTMSFHLCHGRCIRTHAHEPTRAHMQVRLTHNACCIGLQCELQRVLQSVLQCVTVCIAVFVAVCVAHTLTLPRGNSNFKLNACELQSVLLCTAVCYSVFQ